MPELPEVEYARRLAHRVLVERRIERVSCADDRLVFDEDAPERVARALKGRTVVGTGRRGKWSWIEIEEGPAVLVHFGMTGAFRIHGERVLQLQGSPDRDDVQWPPRFVKLELELDDGTAFAITNARRLGRIRLRRDPEAEPPVSELGFDPLNGMPSLDWLFDQLRSRKATLKGILLDQSFSAGVGNWVADEVLLAARLDPRRRGDSLSRKEAAALHRALHRIVARAVEVEADSARFPRGWLFHRRWTPSADARMPNGDAIVWTKVAGRTTALVPSRQR